MPLDIFWHDDERYLEVYIKAHYEDIQRTAWTNGYYAYVGQVLALSKLFSKSKSNKYDYPKYESLLDEVEQEEKKESLRPKGKNMTEQEFRNIMCSCY